MDPVVKQLVTTEFGEMDVELCRKCGAVIYARTHPAARLCARHTQEALAAQPPFACTTADIDAGYEPSDEQIEQAVREAEAQRGTVHPIAQERER